MRKLICWGVTGLAVAAGGYHVMRHAGAPPDSVASRPTVAAEANLVRHAAPEDTACPAAHCVGRCPLQETGSPDGSQLASASAKSESAARAENGEIELQGSAGASSAVIYVPPGEEPPLALPQESAEATAESAPSPVPAVMPYCEDDQDQLVRMPYAADDPWPVTKPGAGSVSPGWFEEAEPEAPATVPECREDDNLSRQYPAVPTTSGAPTGAAPKKAEPWHHKGEPFLPVPPEVEKHAAPTNGAGDIHTRQAERNLTRLGIFEPDPAALEKLTRECPTLDCWLGSASRFLDSVPLAPAGLRKHVSMKFHFGRDGDSAARQPVDTLEARPSDLPKVETEHQPF
jgi:hypothetical protein